MSVLVRCPNPACGRTYGVAEAHLGRKVRCRHCGTAFASGAAALGAGPGEALRTVTPPAKDTLESAASVGPPPAAPPTGGHAGGGPPPRPGLPSQVGRFQVRARLGAGAFGVVYRAFDPQLEREVALKVPHPGTLESPTAVERFLREAKAAARLRHPHIVPVYEAGFDGTHHYIATAFIEGCTLARAGDERRLDFRRAAEVVRDLAEALACAHAAGVVHRDVKPANVMLDTRGAAYLMDFGLAHRREAAAQLTQLGSLLGTPAYMAPEQAAGQSGPPLPASDQYSLGVVLYELLCGRVPFGGPPQIVLFNALHQEPPAPRAVAPGVPPRLEAICLKAMAKEVEDRYASMADFAADLADYLRAEDLAAREGAPAGAPVPVPPTADPMTAREQGGPCPPQPAEATPAAGPPGWVRLLPRRAIGAVGGAAALLVGKVRRLAQGLSRAGTVRAATLARGGRRRLSVVGRLAGWSVQHQNVALPAAALLFLAVGGVVLVTQLRAPRQRQAAGAPRLEEPPPKGEKELPNEAPRQEPEPEALPQLAEEAHGGGSPAPAAGAGGGPPAPRALREPLVLRGHADWVQAVAFSPDGKTLASASIDHTVRLWGAVAGEHKATLRGHTDWVRAVAFSPDSKTLASASDDHTIKLWEAASGKEQRDLKGHTGWVYSVVFSPDGKTLASGSADQTVRLWDAVTGKEKVALEGHSGWVVSVAFSPDGKTLASGSADQTVRLWDAATGQPKATLTGHTGSVSQVAFSPVGRSLASASYDCTVRLWDTAAVTTTATLKGHTGLVLCVAFRPGGKSLATGSSGHTVRLWDVDTGKEKATLEGHTNQVSAVAFSPDGKALASASADGTIRLWGVAASKAAAGPREEQRQDAVPQRKEPTRAGPTRAPREPVVLRGSTDSHAVAFSTDGKALLSAGGRAVRRWDVATRNEKVTPLEGGADRVGVAAFSPDVTLLASAGDDRMVRLWDAATGKLKHTLKGHTDAISAVAFSPDGKTLASASEDRTILVWDAATGRLKATLTGHTGGIRAVAFSPVGRSVAAAGRDDTIRLWDVATSKRTANLTDQRGSFNSVAFSPDGRSLASGSKDGTVLLWDLAGGKSQVIVRDRTGEVFSVAFSPDGKLLAAAGTYRTIRLWNVVTRQVKATLTGHTGTVHAVAFGPDGETLASVSDDRTIRLWDVAALMETYSLQVRAASLYRQKRWPELVQLSRQAIAANPEPKVLYIYLGEALIRQDQFGPAADAFQGHLDRCPNCTSALAGLAVCHIQQGDFDAAVPLLERSVKTWEKNPRALGALAHVHAFGPAKHRDLPRAVQYAERAAALVPNDAASRGELGRVYHQAGRHEQAVQTLGRAAQPDDPAQQAANLLFRALSLQKLGRTEEAKKAYAGALEAHGGAKRTPEQARVWREHQPAAAALLGP